MTATKPSRAAQAWEVLNERQQAYLLVFYILDQQAEEGARHDGARGVDPGPAHRWRRIPLNAAHAPAPRRLQAAGVYDSGAGSTLAALAHRGLIETGLADDALGEVTCVWMTRAGRAAVRDGNPGLVKPRKPQWALSKWLWRQMAKVAAANPDGLADHLFGSAHLYLEEHHRDRRGNRPYLRRQQSPGWNGRWRYFLTDAGRAHYRERLTEYRELYPDVEAPDLPDDEDDQSEKGAQP